MILTAGKKSGSGWLFFEGLFASTSALTVASKGGPEMEGRSTGPGDGENNNNNSFNVEEGLFKVSCDAPVSEAEPVTLQVAPNGPNGEAEVVALLHKLNPDGVKMRTEKVTAAAASAP